MSKAYDTLSGLEGILDNMKKDYDQALEKIKNIAEKLAKGKYEKISTSKLRNLYAHIQAIKAKFQAQSMPEKNLTGEEIREIKRLRYLVAYIAGKEGKKNKYFENFVGKVDNVIKAINTKEDFELFQQFMEALIAYHRFYGGQE